MKVVYCTTVLPSCRRTGGEIASQAFVDGLRLAGFQVTVLGYRRKEDTAPLGVGEIVVGHRPIESDHAGLRAYVWLVKALISGRPYSCEKYISSAYVEQVTHQLRDSGDVIVVVDHAQMGFLATTLPKGQPFVFVAHNIEADIYRGQRNACSGWFRRWLLARESKYIGFLENDLVRRAVQTWVLTASDLSHFTRHSDGNVVDYALPGMEVRDGPAHIPELVWDVGLIGTWTWAANAEGLRWFVEHVLPLLGPGLRIAVAGKGGDAIVTPPVTSLGFVPDAVEFMRSCRVVCIPSVAGGGVQVKTLDAISVGRPIVATPTALRGIADPPVTTVVAETPEEFARCILRAVADADSRLCEHSLQWSRERYRRFNDLVTQSVERLFV